MNENLNVQDRQAMKNISFPIIGPFGWPKYENGLSSLSDIPGVYLMTVRYQDGFLPYSVGVTRRPVRNRFMEHTRAYLNGEYNILDVDSAQQGIRNLLWKGWDWTPEKRADYEARKNEIIGFAKSHMSGTCIFMIDVGVTPRLLERMEAAIANHYYKQEITLFDQGMQLMPRWKTEEPLIATVMSDCRIYGLPHEIEI